MTDSAIWVDLQTELGQQVLQVSVPASARVDHEAPRVVILGSRVFVRHRGRVYREAVAYWAPGAVGQ